MKFAIIENSKVVNVALADQPLADNWVESETAAIGDEYTNGTFATPSPTVDPFAYQRQRAAEYPPMADYVDGIVKGDAAQVQTYIDACLAVKAKYPKPN